MSDSDLIAEILSQLAEAIRRIERRMTGIHAPDDLTADESGIDRLDSICMMLIAIGEQLKHLDRITDGTLLCNHPEVDWAGAKGMRDILSHHYFRADADIIYSVCKDKLPGVAAAIAE